MEAHGHQCNRCGNIWRHFPPQQRGSNWNYKAHCCPSCGHPGNSDNYINPEDVSHLPLTQPEDYPEPADLMNGAGI